MKKRIIAVALSLVLPLPMLFNLSGCSAAITAHADDLMSNIRSNNVSTDIDISGEDSTAVMDFAVRMFQQSAKNGENTLISPISIISALAMTANGAKENTLSEMENVFGLPISKLNEYLYAYRNALPTDKKYKLNIANSIWFKDDDSFTVNQSFLQTNADWYDVDIYKAPFDKSTLKDINSWVKGKTDGMIKDILKEIPDDVVMYLVNALSFDAEWQNIYNEKQVRDGTFTKENKETKDVELMYSTENQFLRDDSAIGFIKYYADRNYAFAALLPNEGVSVTEYIASLTGKRLNEILSNVEGVKVKAAIPKFKFEYSVEMREILMAMGMINAFDYKASDFSGIGTSKNGNISISRVLHKTYITVDEKGTKAGAATVVEAVTESMMEPDREQLVYLDRPFVYMIMDCETNLPIFIGTVMDIDK